MKGRSNRKTSHEFNSSATRSLAMLDITKECKAGFFSMNYANRESEVLRMSEYPELIEYIK